MLNPKSPGLRSRRRSSQTITPPSGLFTSSSSIVERARRPILLAIGLLVVLGTVAYTTTVSSNISAPNTHVINEYKDRISQMELKVKELEEADLGKRALIERLNDDVVQQLMTKGDTDKKAQELAKKRERDIHEQAEKKCKTESDKEKSKLMSDLDKLKDKLRAVADKIPSVQKENPAFLTLVTNNFWKQGIVLVQSARDHGVKHPFIIMAVDPDGMSPSNPAFVKLPAEAEAAFARLNAEVRYIEPVAVPAGAEFENPRWSIAWNKLRAWEFTEFTRLVFLDSDMMVQQDITEMLSFPEFTSAPGQDEPCETHHGINGGVLIFSPNKTVYNELIAFSQDVPSSKWRQAEQELLGHFYMTFYRNKFHLISGLYNISLRSCQCLYPIVLSDHVKIIHFYSGPKPWDHTAQIWADPNLPDLEAPCIAEIILQWYNTLERGLTQ
eukprot:TRINITY_DN460_c0_g2_i1.p1 TRINITY_DN460_c0_g2~~TRINITY_DN460_c0_g2_i1.p1  ORF type:complete len:475 (-),score=102.69 TRINITY_DN460_c0_g2_i1:72-1394(-)